MQDKQRSLHTVHRTTLGRHVKSTSAARYTNVHSLWGDSMTTNIKQQWGVTYKSAAVLWPQHIPLKYSTKVGDCRMLLLPAFDHNLLTKRNLQGVKKMHYILMLAYKPTWVDLKITTELRQLAMGLWIQLPWNVYQMTFLFMWYLLFCPSLAAHRKPTHCFNITHKQLHYITLGHLKLSQLPMRFAGSTQCMADKTWNAHVVKCSIPCHTMRSKLDLCKFRKLWTELSQRLTLKAQQSPSLLKWCHDMYQACTCAQEKKSLQELASNNCMLPGMGMAFTSFKSSTVKRR